MSSRTVSGPRGGKQGILLAVAFGCVVALLGCGGGGSGSGGGGGTTPGVCGSAEGSVTPVLCGTVYKDGTTTVIAGATVVLRTNTGAELTRATTQADGTYKFSSVSSSATQFEVQPPAAGYLPNFSRFGGSVYDYTRDNLAKTSACYMLTGGTIAGDKKLGAVYLFSDSAAPPPPVFTCPH